MIPVRDTALPLLPPFDIRIPKWSLEKLHERVCPICAAGNPALIRRPDRLPVAHCARCDTWYVCALPPESEIDQLYQGYWFTFRPKVLDGEFASRMLSDPAWLAKDLKLDRLEVLSGGLKGKRFLEIGCGAGELLVGAQKRGAVVFGNDVSAESCEFLRTRLKIPVLEGSCVSPDLPAEFRNMDIVVMSDLIEHPVEPAAVFQAALGMLRPGGLCLLLTPNGGGAGSSAESGAEWIGFRVDLEHLQYLSTRTINCLAEQSGSGIEHLETFGFPSLTGLDRVPSGVVIERGWKKRLKQSRLANKAWAAARTLLGNSPPALDVRTGSYHLLAILRKGSRA